MRLCLHLPKAGGKAASFSSLGPFNGRGWTHYQRFLFATRKQKNVLPSLCNYPSSHPSPLLSSSSHCSCLLIHSIHLPIRSPFIHLSSIFPPIHLYVSSLIHPSLTSLPPTHSSIHHSPITRVFSRTFSLPSILPRILVPREDGAMWIIPFEPGKLPLEA